MKAPKFNRKWARAIVPASTSNLGPGFDVLGMSLKLRNEVEISVSSPAGKDSGNLHVEIEGEGSELLDKDEENLVWKSAMKVFFKARMHLKDRRFEMRLTNRIPLARGLGSSSAACLGGILAANSLCGNFLSREEVLDIAEAMEGHPDNVTPSLLGGFCVSAVTGGRTVWMRMSPPKNLRAVVCVPDFFLPTKKARAALPEKIPHADAVFNLSRLGLLLGSFARRDFTHLKLAMEDRMHQPYRKKLVPGFDRAMKSGYRAGALGIALSGAGPSLIAFSSPSKAQAVGREMAMGFKRAGKSARSMVLDFDGRGAAVEAC